MRTETTTTVPGWVRLALVALGLPNLLTGAWALLAPENWFDRFPGFDPRLVAAEPPYNAHLATDAGAGFLATGAIVVVAAWFGDRRSVRLGLVAYALFAIPHALYHTLDPSPGLTGAEDVQNAATLVFAAVVTLVLLVVVGRSEDRTPVPARGEEVAV